MLLRVLRDAQQALGQEIPNGVQVICRSVVQSANLCKHGETQLPQLLRSAIGQLSMLLDAL